MKHNCILTGTAFIADFFSVFIKECREKGLSEDAMVHFLKAENIPQAMGRFVADLVLTQAHSLRIFFSDQGDVPLLMSPHFKEKILLGDLEYVVKICKTRIYNLEKEMLDREIVSELGVCSFPSRAELLSVLMEKIRSQPNNLSAGDLLIDGRRNIFYVKLLQAIVVVLLTWETDKKKWFLGTLRFSDLRWQKGSRIFSYE